MSDPINAAVELLNDVLERDRNAITRLINMRVDCDETLSRHPTLQVQKIGDSYRVGVLGILNGILGGSPNGDIGAKGTIETKTGMFTQIRKFIDLREERLNILA